MPFHRNQTVIATVDEHRVCWIKDPETSDNYPAELRLGIGIPIEGATFEAVVINPQLADLEVKPVDLPMTLTEVEVVLKQRERNDYLEGNGIHLGFEFPIYFSEELLEKFHPFLLARMSLLRTLRVDAVLDEEGMYTATALSPKSVAEVEEGRLCKSVLAEIVSLRESNKSKSVWFSCKIDLSEDKTRQFVFDANMFVSIDEEIPLVSSGFHKLYLRSQRGTKVLADVKINNGFLNLSPSPSLLAHFLDKEKEFYAEIFKQPDSESVSVAVWSPTFDFALIVTKAWRSRFNEIGLFDLAPPSGGIGNFDTDEAEAIWAAENQSFTESRFAACVSRIKLKVKQNRKGFFDVIEVTSPRGVRAPKQDGELVHYLPATVSTMPRYKFKHVIFRFMDPNGIGNGEALLYDSTPLRKTQKPKSISGGFKHVTIQKTIMPYVEIETKALISLRGRKRKWSVFTVHSFLRKNENPSETC